MIWTPPKTWVKSDNINVPDWQRIDDNTRWIAEFYGVTLPYKTWAHTSFPTPMEMARIQSNIEALIKYFQGVYAGSRIEISQKFSGEMQSLTVTGKTLETGTGDKSPDNPYALLGAQKVKVCQNNLLPNSDFAENTDGWQLVGPNVVRDPSVTLDGSVAIKSEQSGLINDAWRGARLFHSNQPFAKPGDRFTASVYIMTDDVSTLDRGVAVEFWQSDSKGIRHYLNSYTVKADQMQNNQWKKIALPMNAAIRPDCVSVYIYFFVIRNGRCWFAKPQIEYGNTATIYEPYNGQTVALPQPLYSLPDGTADSYDAISGSGTQNVGKKILDGTTSWSANPPWDAQAPDYLHVYTWITGRTLASRAVCSHFPVVYAYNGNLNKNCIHVENGTTAVYIFIAKSLLATPDAAGLKAWLAVNPVTLLYELAEPQAITGTPQTIQTYYPYTQITNDAGAEMTAVMKGDNHSFQTKFDWNLLNDIESLLLEMHAKVVELQLSVRRSGTFVSGQETYIPLGGT